MTWQVAFRTRRWLTSTEWGYYRGMELYDLEVTHQAWSNILQGRAGAWDFNLKALFAEELKWVKAQKRNKKE